MISYTNRTLETNVQKCSNFIKSDIFDQFWVYLTPLNATYTTKLPTMYVISGSNSPKKSINQYY